MDIATTLEVRKLMREKFGLRKPYSNRSSDSNVTYLTFVTDPRPANGALMDEVVQALADLGYSNRVSVTQGCYLNVNARKS